MKIQSIVFDSDKTFVMDWPEGWPVPNNNQMLYYQGIRYKIYMVEWIASINGDFDIRLRITKN